MNHFLSKISITSILLGAVLFFMLSAGNSWADTFKIPGTNTEVTYDPRANFDVPILSGGSVTTTHVSQDFSLILCNGYQDVYYLNMVRNRDNYTVYKGYAKYRGFSLSGCSTTGEVTLMRMKETPSMPEHFSIVSTSVRWNNTLYILNDVFRWLNSTTMAGYENWYPFDMSCSVAFYIVKGGF